MEREESNARRRWPRSADASSGRMWGCTADFGGDTRYPARPGLILTYDHVFFSCSLFFFFRHHCFIYSCASSFANLLPSHGFLINGYL